MKKGWVLAALMAMGTGGQYGMQCTPYCDPNAGSDWTCGSCECSEVSYYCDCPPRYCTYFFQVCGPEISGSFSCY